MCTVSIVPLETGFRVGCNRDERLTRPAPLPPHVERVEEMLAVFPTDVAGGGTWIGVNQRGLVAVCLNRTVPGDRGASDTVRCSRGIACRHLLGAADITAAIRRVLALPLRAFDPFTAVVVQGRELVVITNDGYEYRVDGRTLDQPTAFTSSSLGDALVQKRRLDLFDELVSSAETPLASQTIYHAHRWADAPHLSVNMCRTDAGTVSRTWIEVDEARAQLTYEPIAGEPVVVALPLTGLPWTNSPASFSRPS